MSGPTATSVERRTQPVWLEFVAFAERYELEATDATVVLFLTELHDAAGLTGRVIRQRLCLLDAAFARQGLEPLLRSKQVRQFLRGLHQLAPLGPVRQRDVLYLEDVLAMLDTLTALQPRQAQARALLFLANATGLPLSTLRTLTWNDVRRLRGGLVINVDPRVRRMGPSGKLQVDGATFPVCVAAMRDLRRTLGPAHRYVFGSTPTIAASRPWSVGVLSGLPNRGATWRWEAARSLPEEELHSLGQRLLTPSAAERRARSMSATPEN